MTTTQAKSLNESWQIGSLSKVNTRSPAPVLYREFSSPRPLPLENTVSLDSLLAEFESDQHTAEEMTLARKHLASEMYSDEPDTLSALRLGAGLSQAQLAKLVETSQPHIARIEKGVTDPGTDMISRIATALGIDEVRAFRAVRLQLQTRGQQK